MYANISMDLLQLNCLIIILSIIMMTIKSNEIEYSKAIKDLYRFSDHGSHDKSGYSTSPALYAILTECPPKHISISEPEQMDCQEKIVVNIRINDEKRNKLPSDEHYEKYLLLDELFDQHKKSKAKLILPYLIEIALSDPILIYPLQFIKKINNLEEIDKMNSSMSNEKNVKDPSEDEPNGKFSNHNTFSDHIEFSPIDNDNDYRSEYVKQNSENSDGDFASISNPYKKKKSFYKRQHKYENDNGIRQWNRFNGNMDLDIPNIFKSVDSKENEIKKDIEKYALNDILRRYDNVNANDDKRNNDMINILDKININTKDHNRQSHSSDSCKCREYAKFVGDEKCKCCESHEICHCNNHNYLNGNNGDDDNDNKLNDKIHGSKRRTSSASEDNHQLPDMWPQVLSPKNLPNQWPRIFRNRKSHRHGKQRKYNNNNNYRHNYKVQSHAINDRTEMIPSGNRNEQENGILNSNEKFNQENDRNEKNVITDENKFWKSKRIGMDEDYVKYENDFNGMIDDNDDKWQFGGGGRTEEKEFESKIDKERTYRWPLDDLDGTDDNIDNIKTNQQFESPPNQFIYDKHLNTNDKLRMLDIFNEPHPSNPWAKSDVHNTMSRITRHVDALENNNMLNKNQKQQHLDLKDYSDEYNLVDKENHRMNNFNRNEGDNKPETKFERFRSEKKQETLNHHIEHNKKRQALENVWYSVYNIGAPSLSLTVQIRILKRQDNMWKAIVKPITLTSLSKAYADANLSILFSYHLDNKEPQPLDSNRYKILIPEPYDNDIHTVLYKDFITDDMTMNFTTIVGATTTMAPDLRNQPINATILPSVHGRNNSNNVVDQHKHGKRYKNHKENWYNDVENRRRKNSTNNAVVVMDNRGLPGVRRLIDMGYFTIGHNCGTTERQDYNIDIGKLCLNMFVERVPDCRVAIDILPPQKFTNKLIYPNIHQLEIVKIIADGTIYDKQFIEIEILNDRSTADTVTICIGKLNSQSCMNSVQQILRTISPKRTIKVYFILNLPILESSQKHNFEVQLRDQHLRIITKRNMITRTMGRCICLWQCLCTCLTSFATTDATDMCQQMDDYNLAKAGFDSDLKNTKKIPSSNLVWDWNALIIFILFILVVAIILGCLKALIGICLEKVDKWKYNYLQPTPFDYGSSSRCKRFFINTIFFVVFPCVALCKCFQVNEVDLQTMSEYEKSLTRTATVYNAGNLSEERYPLSSTDICKIKDIPPVPSPVSTPVPSPIRAPLNKNGSNEPQETTKLIEKTQPNEEHIPNGSISSMERIRLRGGTSVYSDSDGKKRKCSIERIFEIYDEEDEENDTDYVLTALNESQDSLRLMENDCHQTFPENTCDEIEDSKKTTHNQCASDVKREETFIQRLLTKKIAYRRISEPIGLVNIPINQPYSIRGYFIDISDRTSMKYQFFTPVPLRQHWLIQSKGKSLIPVQPPISLMSNDFTRVYTSDQDVYDAADLSIEYPWDAPCISTLVQDISL